VGLRIAQQLGEFAVSGFVHLSGVPQAVADVEVIRRALLRRKLAGVVRVAVLPDVAMLVVLTCAGISHGLASVAR